MKAEDQVRLDHMREAAQAAMSFMAGRTRIDLDADLMLLFAVVRAVEIIGEAASRLSAEAREALSDVPWSALIGMRNRLVHAYFNVDRELVWKTVTEELPRLMTALDKRRADK
jgi:uncharacterized protein with HEPN domain